MVLPENPIGDNKIQHGQTICKKNCSKTLDSVINCDLDWYNTTGSEREYLTGLTERSRRFEAFFIRTYLLAFSQKSASFSENLGLKRCDRSKKK